MRAALLLAAAAAFGASACAGSNAPTPLPGLQLSCPLPVTAESIAGEPRGVEYQAATADGGTAPVTASCAPASGSTFPLGTTNVKCTAVDAKQQQAACEFNVTVKQPGTLSATRFMAYGDSLTFGSPPTDCPVFSSGITTREWMARDLLLVRPRADDEPPPSAYPTVLQGLLAGRYLSQSTAVFNDGKPGERVSDDFGGTNDETLTRLRSRLQIRNPQVMLLVEGANDLRSYNGHIEQIPVLIKALRDMVAEARARGVVVLLGTLPPEDASGCRGSFTSHMVVPTNDQIKTLAGDGVHIVDLYQGLGGAASGSNVGFDGLHLTPEGYNKMAQTFLSVIRERLEVPR